MKIIYAQFHKPVWLNTKQKTVQTVGHTISAYKDLNLRMEITDLGIEIRTTLDGKEHEATVPLSNVCYFKRSLSPAKSNISKRSSVKVDRLQDAAEEEISNGNESVNEDI